MSKERTQAEIQNDALKRARVLAYLMQKKISAWRSWVLYPTRNGGEMPDYEAQVREQLLELVAVIYQASEPKP